VRTLPPDEEVIRMLDTIEEHHGEYSADPPYSILEFIGCPDSERLRSALAEFGFRVEASSSGSIVAVRAL
jgi:hypothetical protein